MINHVEKENQVSAFVTKITGVSMDDMKSKSRMKRFVEARSLYSYILRTFLWSFPEIGSYISRDHTTVMHLVKMFKSNPSKDEIDVKIINEFKNDLPSGFPQHL